MTHRSGSAMTGRKNTGWHHNDGTLFFLISLLLLFVSDSPMTILAFMRVQPPPPIDTIRSGGIRSSNEQDCRPQIKPTGCAGRPIGDGSRTFATKLFSTTQNVRASKPTDGKQETRFVRFSRCFQRHVVYGTNKTVLSSFRFLDEAFEEFPRLYVVKDSVATTNTTPEEIQAGYAAGGGLQEAVGYAVYLDTNQTEIAMERGRGALLTLCELVTGEETSPLVDSFVAMVGTTPLLRHNNDTITSNFGKFQKLMENALGLDFGETRSRIIAPFPQVCLYDLNDIAERLAFLLAPLPPRDCLTAGTEVDWPLLFSKGYGVGIDRKVVRECVLALPHLLAMTYEDSASKPSLMYYYLQLRVMPTVCNEANAELSAYLSGATASDVCVAAYMKSCGTTWEQLRVLYDACPVLAVSTNQPTWEMSQRGTVTSVLKDNRLHYLQRRLQIRPEQVQAMLKTHSRISSYSVQKTVKPALDVLQSSVGLSSREVTSIVLRMPSLLGTSSQEGKGLSSRIQFLRHEVGMTDEQIRRAVIVQPSILQYNVERQLRPKLSFLKDTLRIPAERIPMILTRTPSILGLSLEKNLKPSAASFQSFCGLSDDETGIVFSKEARLLVANWRGNLLPTLQYLQDRMVLSRDQIRTIVLRNPTSLLRSTAKTLRPRIDNLEKILAPVASSSTRESQGTLQSATPNEQDSTPRHTDLTVPVALAQIIVAKPSLLTCGNTTLMRYLTTVGVRMGGTEDTGKIRTRSVAGVGQQPTSRSKTVLAIDASGAVKTFLSVKAAATHLGISVSTMYCICREQKQRDGVTYCYEVDRERCVAQMDKAPTPVSPVFPRRHLTLFACGATYPPDTGSQARGIRRTGGVALYIPQVDQGDAALLAVVRGAAAACFKDSVPQDVGAMSFENGVLLLGYPYLWASNRRCSLCACYDALRLIVQVLEQESKTREDFNKSQYDFTVSVESNYALHLLSNTTALLEWGSLPSVRDLRQALDGPQGWANEDLLFPVSLMYRRILQFRQTGAKTRVRFLHAAEGSEDVKEERIRSLARVAAQWRYSSVS